MAIRRLPRPRDPLQLGKLVGDILTGQVRGAIDDGKRAAAAELGTKGGQGQPSDGRWRDREALGIKR